MSRFKRANKDADAPKHAGGRPVKIKLGAPIPEVSQPEIKIPFKLDDKRNPIGAEKSVAIPVRDLLRNLGSIHATTRETAAILGISEPTLFAFFDREPEAREIFDGGKEIGKVSLRRKQMNLAEKNASMAIFLGMNYLGQHDMRFLAMQGNINHTISPLGKLLKEIDDGRHGKVIEHDPSEPPKLELARAIDSQ